MTPPKRQLGISIAAAIVVANMIGAGVFTSAGYQAAGLHDPMTMLLTWVVGGLLALCGAACYAELGSLMPRAGGEYVYLREAYSPAIGFMSGWVSLTAGFSAPIAAAALLFSGYLGKVVPAIAGTYPEKAVATVLVLAMSLLHAFDTRLGGRVQTGFTIAKVGLIVVFIVAGVLVGSGNWGNLATVGDGLGQLTTKGGLEAFATALMYVSFAYSGWNAAAYIAGEIEKPQRTLPRALLLGTGVVMGLYILLNVVFLYAASPAEMVTKDGPVHEVGDLAARHLFNDTAGNVLSTMIALALVSSVSAMMMAGPRVYAAMAADRALPRILATYSKRGVPAIAVATQAVLAIVFVWLGNVRDLIEFVGFTLAIFAALTVGAVFVFRFRVKRMGELRVRFNEVLRPFVDKPELERAVDAVHDEVRTHVQPYPDMKVSSYRTWGYPVTPILFIGLSAWVVYLKFTAAPGKSALVALLLVVGAFVYMATSKGTEHTKIEEDE